MQASMPKQAGDSDLMNDSDNDDLPSSLDDSENEDIQSNARASTDDVNDDADHSDALSLAEGSDNDDLLDLDDDLPAGLIDYSGSDAGSAAGGDEISNGFEGGQKRKRNEENKDRGKRKKLRSLPTFASYEDYAKMIEEGPEDDI